MPLSDYSHWNEEASRVWWEEEGKHEGMQEPTDDNDDQDWRDCDDES